MSQKYNNNMRSKPQDNWLGILKIYALCQKIQQRASDPQKMVAGICLWEPHLVVQRRVRLEHSSHVSKVGVEATCLHFSPWCILKELNKPAGPFGTMQQEPWYPQIGAKLVHAIQQFTHREVCTHASYKTTRKW